MSERPSRRSQRRPGLRVGRAVQVALVLALLSVSIGLILLRPDLVAELQGELLQNPSLSIALLGGLFVLFSLSQVIILPSGTALLLATGALLGPISGVIYAIAMTATAPLVYLTARAHPREARRVVIRSLPAGRWRKRLMATLRSMQKHPVLGTAILRLMPVIPSAVTCLSAGALGVPLRGFLLGSVLTGPIRPVVISTLGYTAGAALTGAEAMSPYLVAGLAAISFACLGASLWLMKVLVRRANIQF